MSDVFEKYRKLYGIKEEKQITVIVDEEPEPLQAVSIVAHPPRVKETDHPDEVRKMIRQLLDQESHIRNQREKYRMNYYRLESQGAPKEKFAENFAIIKSLTDQLAPIYIQRRKIEESGKIECKKEITQDEENQIRRLKYDKKRLIDKKHKIGKKIENYMSYAKGPQNLPSWESDLELVKIQIYEIDEEIKKIEGS